MIFGLEIGQETPPQVAFDEQGCQARREQPGRADPDNEDDHGDQAPRRRLGGLIEAAEEQDPDAPERIGPGAEVGVDPPFGEVEARGTDQPDQQDRPDDPGHLVAVPGRERGEDGLTPGAIAQGAKDLLEASPKGSVHATRNGTALPERPGAPGSCEDQVSSRATHWPHDLVSRLTAWEASDTRALGVIDQRLFDRVGQPQAAMVREPVEPRFPFRRPFQRHDRLTHRPWALGTTRASSDSIPPSTSPSRSEEGNEPPPTGRLFSSSVILAKSPLDKTKNFKYLYFYSF